jgi:hypothetical protein
MSLATLSFFVLLHVVVNHGFSFIDRSSIPSSDDTYIHDAELRKDFIKVSNVLKLFPVAQSTQSDVQKTLDVVMETLRSI